MNRLLRHVARWGRDRSGAAAVEYAFVLPVFAMLLIGVINMSQLMGALSGMHFAVEEAARCSAVRRDMICSLCWVRSCLNCSRCACMAGLSDSMRAVSLAFFASRNCCSSSSLNQATSIAVR